MEGHFQDPERRSLINKIKRIKEIEQESEIKLPTDKPEVAQEEQDDEILSLVNNIVGQLIF
jgi:hypothetical protein